MRDLVNDAHDAKDSRALVWRIGRGLGALPLTHVVETLRPLPTEPIAGTPAFVSGLAVIRGVGVPVVDAARLLAGSAAPAAETDHKARRWIVIDAGGRRVALAVDEVVGVRPIPAASRGSLPPLLGNAGADAIETVGALDAQLLLVLQAGRLLPDEVALP